MKFLSFSFLVLGFLSCSIINGSNVVEASFNLEGEICKNGCKESMEKKLASLDGIEQVQIVSSKNIIKVKFNDGMVSKDYIKSEVESLSGGQHYKVSACKITSVIAIKEIEELRRDRLTNEKINTDYFPTRVSFPSIFQIFFPN